MKKLKQKVAFRREFVRMVTLAAPAILIASSAAAYNPTEEYSTGITAPQKRRHVKRANEKSEVAHQGDKKDRDTQVVLASYFSCAQAD